MANLGHDAPQPLGKLWPAAAKEGDRVPRRHRKASEAFHHAGWPGCHRTARSAAACEPGSTAETVTQPGQTEVVPISDERANYTLDCSTSSWRTRVARIAVAVGSPASSSHGTRRPAARRGRSVGRWRGRDLVLCPLHGRFGLGSADQCLL